MKKQTEINKEFHKKLSDLYDTLGIFFAFSQEQFNESKKEGVIYVHAGQGMIIPKNNVKKFCERYRILNEELKSNLQKNIKMDDYIFSELKNNECFYTGNYREILPVVKRTFPRCTLKDIKRVYDANNV